MARKFDPKAKAKRQKIIAGALGLVLVGVLIFQAPTILGMFGGGSSTPVSEPGGTATPAPAPAAAPTAGAPVAAPAALAGSAELVDSDPAPIAADGQLVTFDRFESKDPFAPQGEGAGATGAQPSAPPVPVDPGAKAEAPRGENVDPAPPPPPPATSRTATISVNGSAHEVKVGGTFPESDPIFKLVSLKGASAKVGIVGGTYATGSQTIALQRGGKPVTLMNTADGTTYVLRFVR